MSNDDPFTQAGDALSKLFDRLIPTEAQEYNRLNTGWKQIVGEEASFHVIPKDIVNGILILESDHPGWTQRIRMMESQIYKTIRSRYPELKISRIVIQMSDL